MFSRTKGEAMYPLEDSALQSVSQLLALALSLLAIGTTQVMIASYNMMMLKPFDLGMLFFGSTLSVIGYGVTRWSLERIVYGSPS